MGLRQVLAIAQFTLAVCVVMPVPATAQDVGSVSPAVPAQDASPPTPVLSTQDGSAAPPVLPVQSTTTGTTTETAADYVLGPDDVITIKALDAEEISSGGIRVDPSGNISLPLLGRIAVGGLTVERLERELASRLKTYVRDPVVAVTITDYRSQPVTVIGAVAQSGVHQLEGRKTLIEVLAKAGGLRPEAGNVIKITRKAEWGMIPLPSASKDPTGQFSVAEVSLKNIMQATNPEENFLILPNDIISIPRADVVYVMGEVKKPGGFALQERGSISGLQALAMAQGFTPAPGKAMIIRQSGQSKHVEIQADLSKILGGQQPDIELLPDDILLVPKNQAKSTLINVAETAIRATTSALIYRGF
jgi:polysaccharide export outer membrane protein